MLLNKLAEKNLKNVFLEKPVKFLNISAKAGVGDTLENFSLHVCTRTKVISFKY
jgi:hypothetical protein